MSAKFRHAFEPREIVYPSNLLTLARLLMLPAAVRAMHQPDGRWRALTTLGIAMVTDAIDGPIARHRHEVSPLGQVLDPIADKLMIDATAVALSRKHGFPWWVTVLLIGRDVVILFCGMLMYRRRAQIAVAHPAGKLTTVALTVAMLLHLADGPRSGRPALYLALLPFLGSLVAYWRGFWRAMRGDR